MKDQTRILRILIQCTIWSFTIFQSSDSFTLFIYILEACDGILTRLENTEVPLDSPTIARSFGDSCNIWTIRENLYRLEDMGMIRKIDQDGWILSQNDKRTGNYAVND